VGFSVIDFVLQSQQTQKGNICGSVCVFGGGLLQAGRGIVQKAGFNGERESQQTAGKQQTVKHEG